ncbi:Sterol uptake control protein 2 [Fusarium oxysporum f. sp. cubense]|uniref:Sterol uptake control protein 2 n=1 Tax=Fusarium oxysporum f. sp. cubense TaxID=61366 RepID=A0A559L9U9_FUSOC|nr:Sterol uptake control protein 2 [Fusarium oxysporum f. sp. cubense]
MAGHATDETKGKGKVRQRRAHTRSRTGCSECRSHRVRCGEQRPTCENCVNSRRTCEYPPVKIPLRERRALEKAGATQPWEHVPWEAPSSSKGPEVPNTQALVITNSPFVYGETLFTSLTEKQKDCMPYTISDPEALRNAILMAATHFTFKVGSLEAFEHTFLFHRIETVRLVKKWLSIGDLTLSAAITKQIATLAYTEFCSGDMQMAEKHLNVIYALPCRITDPSNNNGKTRDQELSDHYFLLTSTFIHGVQTVLYGILRAEDSTQHKNSLSVSDPMRLMHKWYKSEGHYLHCLKLKAIRLFSTFFILPDIGARLSDVYSASIVNSLRKVTDEFYNLTEAQKIHNDFWRTGAAARVYDAVLESHQTSISSTDHEHEAISDAEQKTSWCGLVIAAELFLEQVVVLWRPFTKEIYLCSMRIFQRDLSFALQKPNTPEIAELLFWESFLGLMSLYLHEKLGDMKREPGLKPFFERIIKEQSRDMGLAKWEDARRVLLNIAWPLDFSEDDYVKRIWEAAIAD